MYILLVSTCRKNLKEAITQDREGNVLSKYTDREKEYKNENGGNTGEYRHVEENATYVEIKAKMNITKPQIREELELQTLNIHTFRRRSK